MGEQEEEKARVVYDVTSDAGDRGDGGDGGDICDDTEQVHFKRERGEHSIGYIVDIMNTGLGPTP